MGEHRKLKIFVSAGVVVGLLAPIALAATPAAADPPPPGLACTITGTTGDDVLNGTSGDDVICGLAGNDTINGGDGNDTLRGDDGIDTLQGQGGDDRLEGGANNDVLRGGAGDDSLSGGDGTDTVAYELAASSVSVHLSRQDGFDGEIPYSAGNGVAGEDDRIMHDVERAIGGAFDDLITGTEGIDTLEGRGGNDLIDGLGSGDIIVGEAGDDDLRGGDGNDILIPGLDNDVVDGGDGVDRVDMTAGEDGDDVFIGGPGVDTLNYSTRTDPVFVDLSTDAHVQGRYDPVGGGTLEGDSAVGFEGANGGFANDLLIGSVGADRLQGFGSADELRPGPGPDQVFGGDGHDVVRTVDGEVDTVDCGAGTDQYDSDIGLDLLTACETQLDPAVGEGGPGSVDETYGVDGVAMSASGGLMTPGHSAVGAPDGSVVFVTRGPSSLELNRLLPDGTPDPAFGVDGLVITPLEGGIRSGSSDANPGLAVDPASGDLYLAATEDVGGTRVPAVARYSAAGVLEELETYPVEPGGVWPDTATATPGKAVGIVISNGTLLLAAVLGEVDAGDAGFLRLDAGSLDALGGRRVPVGDIATYADFAVRGNRAYLAVQRPDTTLMIRVHTVFEADPANWAITTFDGAPALLTLSLQIDDVFRPVLLTEDSGGPEGERTLSVQRWNLNGAVDATFGGDGHAGPFVMTPLGSAEALRNSTGARLVLDDRNRPVVSSTWSTPPTDAATIRVLRLRTDGGRDLGFGDQSVAEVSGPSTRFSTQLVHQADGRLLVVTESDGPVQAIQVEAARVTDVTSTTVGASPDGTAPGRRATPREGLAAAASAFAPAGITLDDAGAALQGAPWKNNPWKNNPWKNNPWKNNPWKNNPWKNNAVLASTSVASLLLFGPPSWSERFVGSRWEGQPPQTVTVGEILNAELAPGEHDPFEGLTMGDVDITRTRLAHVSTGALLLTGVAVGDLPPPPTGSTFCGADPCRTPIDDDTTLLDLELGGDDLTSYLSRPLSVLSPTDIDGSTLATYLLTDTDLAVTGFAHALIDDLGARAPEIVVPGSCVQCETLLDAAAAGALQPTATIGQLIEVLEATGYFTNRFPRIDLTLGELIAAILPEDEAPISQLPREAVLDQATFRDTGFVTLSTTFELDCTAGPPSQIFVTPVVPPRARYVPGTSQLVISGEGGDTYNLFDPESPGLGELETGPLPPARYDLAPNPDDGTNFLCPLGVERQTVTILGDYEPGEVLGTFTASASVKVDSLGARTTDETAVLVTDRLEPADDDPAAAPIVDPGSVYAGHLSYAGDEDYVRVQVPADATPGSRLTVTLSHLPGDYDLAVAGGGVGASRIASPWKNNPWKNNPWKNNPWKNNALPDTSTEPGADAAVLPPEGSQDLPFRSPEFQTNAVRGSSINRGLATESITTTIRAVDVGQTIKIGVGGYNGASSSLPYLLDVAYRPAPQLPPCIAPRNLSTAPAGTLPALPVPNDRETLILIAPSRMPGLDVAQLQAFAARGDVRGSVLAVDADPAVAAAYAAWDASPCSVEAANTVVSRILDVIARAVPGNTDGLRHLVVVGGDDVIPQGRVFDNIGLANQADHALEVTYGGRSNPLSAAFGGGFLLSDDPYGSFAPFDFLQADLLYLPNVAIGRLIETPADVSAAITSFTTAGGVLRPDKAFTAGYDFLADGAAAVHEHLADAVGTANAQLRNDDPRSTRDPWTGPEAIAGINAAAGGFASVNGHYDQYRMLPASGFADAVDALTGGLAPELDSIIFTVGCHAGLNVPELVSTNEVLTTDWAQAAAERGALFVGNTGYGYGDTDTVAASEKLMAYAAENLTSGEMTAGQALLYAKLRYLGEAKPVAAHDAKVTAVSSFYGLPMWRIGDGGGVAAPALPEGPAPDDGVVDEEIVELTPTYVTRNGTDGAVIEASAPGTTNTVQASAYRPLSWNLITELGPGKPVHGVLIDALDTVDGAPTRPSRALMPTDSSASVSFPDFEDVTFPVRLADARSMPGPEGREDLLIYSAVQWSTEATTDPGDAIPRTARSVTLRALRSDSTDYEAPHITSSRGYLLSDGTGVIHVGSDSPDAVAGVVLYRLDVDGASGPWRRAELVRTGPDSFGAALSGLPTTAAEITEYTVQLHDGANVGWSSEKRNGYRAELIAEPGPGAHLAADRDPDANGFYRTAPTVVLEDAVPGITYTVSVNGSTPAPYTGPVSLPAGDGPFEVTFEGSDGSTGTVVVLVDGTGPSVTGEATPQSGGGVLVTFTCADGVSGVASCPSPVTVTSNGDVVRTATDRAGNSSTVTVPVEGADSDPPTITATVSPAPNTAGWHNTAGPVTVTYTCADTGGSGVASCPPPATVTTQGVTTVTGTAMDNAGNSASVDTVVRIDRTAPAVSVSSALILVAAPVRGAATDALSGVERVRVTFAPILIGVARTVDATLTCSADGRSCTWSARPPGLLGIYKVTVVAIDRAGNQSTPVGPLVINLL